MTKTMEIHKLIYGLYPTGGRGGSDQENTEEVHIQLIVKNATQ